MGGKPEQGACTSEADLPQITNVVRHMQKMTRQAQGVARGARTSEVAGYRYAFSCISVYRCCICITSRLGCARRSSRTRVEDLSPSPRDPVSAQTGTPMARAPVDTSEDATIGGKSASERSSSMRPMSFIGASTRVSPRVGSTRLTTLKLSGA